MQLSVIVPCYNEADSLPELVERFRNVFKDRDGCELVLVNNGTKDNSSAVLDQLLTLPEYAFALCVTVPVNQGYGHGILVGLREASGEFLAWTHADLQTDPADVVTAFDQIRSRPDREQCFVTGRRKGRPLFDRYFTGSMSLVASLALGESLRDVNAQPKLFPAYFLRELDNAPDDFSLDLYFLFRARRSGLTQLIQPVEFAARRAGEAKGGGSFRCKVRLTRRTWAFIWELRRRPSAERCDRQSSLTTESFHSSKAA